MATSFPQSFGIAAWRATASESFGQLNVSAPEAGKFWATLSTASVEEVAFFDMHTSAHTVTRPRELIAPADAAYCKLSLQLSGHSLMTQDGRTCQLHPGNLALYVTDRPYTLNYPSEQRTLVMRFPAHLLHLSPAQVRHATASPISREHGLGKVAVPLFEQLARNLDILEGPHASALIHSAINVLVAVLSAQLAAFDSSSANLLVTRATTYIDNHLGDPDLSPSTIARALFVSVRHLHARFSAHGLSVGSYIRTQRLNRIRGELADPLHAQESIGTISARYGLHDPSHFSRVFKAEFQESPSAYRSRILTAT